MVKNQSQDRDKSVTLPPILIPGTREDQDGISYFLQGKQTEFVRRFTSDYVKKGTAHNAELLRYLAGEGKQLEALLALRAAAESGDDPDTLKRFLAETLKVPKAERADVVLQHSLPVAARGVLPAKLRAIFATTKSANPQLEARFWLSPLWTKAMSSARIVLWWANVFEGRPCRRFIPAIYCPNFKTALYVREALGGRRVCLGCGELFMPERTNQLYHANGRCGDRHRKRRQRNKSEQSKSKHRKTGGS